MARRREGTVAAEGAEGEAPDRNRPAHMVRLRNIRAAIWANEGDRGAYYNATFHRLYKDDEGMWRTSDGFGRDDLLLLAKVADLAHTWISETMQAQDAHF